MLREAAVVAAVVGSVGMIGAGVASAGGWEHPNLVGPFCNQTNGDTNTTDAGGLTLPALLGTAGNGSANAYGNICGHGNDGNTVTGGEATGGEAALA